ncbi:IMPACT family protein [Pseudochrobactrum sp. sp1633]|uniref:IMPACT family protein n=1 Tax=Pseudochrobactrum sp. sp1633 TaxID=3036706 RepID=UPI0025A59318|nr:YigZ family protein [Pseudochrobactrum sp. sp1633]MDM8346396.1 IMPACT family protein [Pseudochrobactrum sp. sp1633]HWD14233.1 YigZ family protein [Pseudochrobactrum sp.]
MFTLAKREVFEQEIKRSRFLAIALPVADEDAAKDFIARESYSDANHNCWAWRIGQNYRFNDDGEPSGTAGKPILQAIDGLELDNVAVLVTRWFGGTLLGSGGLIRAYGGSAALCLRAAELIELIPTETVYIRAHFSELALIKARLAGVEHLAITSEAFHNTGADLRLEVPVAEKDTVLRMLTDITHGRIQISDKAEDLSF